jgi:hypothetical protein
VQRGIGPLGYYSFGLQILGVGHLFWRTRTRPWRMHVHGNAKIENLRT